MAIQQTRRYSAYGLIGPTKNIFPDPIILKTGPATTDAGEIGQVAIVPTTQTAYMLTSNLNGINTWSVLSSGSGETLASLTVTPGPTSLTGALTQTGGDLSLGADATSKTISIGSVTGASATTIRGGTSGITLNATTSNVTVLPTTATSGTTSATITGRVGVATFTGQTTAAAGSITFTITNTFVTATSAVFVSISTLGSNIAALTVTRILPAANTLTVTAVNNGSAAINGNVILTFWVIA